MPFELFFKRTRKPVLILAVVLGMFSCTDHIVFDQYKNIDDHQWNKNSVLTFTFNSLDTVSRNNIYINIRNDQDYEFSNLFLIVGIKFPNAYRIIDTLEYEMTDINGRFLGTGMSDIKENKLEYKTNVTFPVQGEYDITVQQAMRKDQNIKGLVHLRGITDVGIAIEKIK
jgi:gliding motility-associated lipoprotein GldH